MKAERGGIARQVDQPDTRVRLYLFYGPDESGSRALAQRLAKALGADKLALSGADLRSDPARLADEAQALALFGGRRLIWVEPAGEEVLPAVAGLLDASATEHVTVLIAGALKKSSELVRLAEANAQTLAHQSFIPEGATGARMVAELARSEGLRPAPDVAARLAAACGGDQAVAALELAKLALYLNASPESPRELDHSALDAVSADYSESDARRIGDLALAGDVRALCAELDRLEAVGFDAIGAVRALNRRLMTLAPLAAKVAAGQSVGAVVASAGNAIFWKEKELVEHMLRRWDSRALAELIGRTGELELQMMRSETPAGAMLGEELVMMARRR